VTSLAPPGLLLRIGYEIVFDVPAPTPMLLMLYVHPTVAQRLQAPETIYVEPHAPITEHVDDFGNRVGRMIAQPGQVRIYSESVIADSGLPDVTKPDAQQHRVEDLPPEVLPYLLGSRYCEVDRLSAVAWDLFGKTPPGYARVQAVNDWVHRAIEFGYRHARPNKTALDVYTERRGVCRDYMHLAITFCRALGIPARYATGYLSDINAAPDPTPMDFSAFYEVYLDNQWWPFDARYGVPRIGRILMARGRDAVDVALTTSFGPTRLLKFKVTTEEANPAPAQQQQTLQIHEAPHPVPQAIAV
jgi:transglutaminase-like putative cysteine protease